MYCRRNPLNQDQIHRLLCLPGPSQTRFHRGLNDLGLKDQGLDTSCLTCMCSARILEESASISLGAR